MVLITVFTRFSPVTPPEVAESARTSTVCCRLMEHRVGLIPLESTRKFMSCTHRRFACAIQGSAGCPHQLGPMFGAVATRSARGRGSCPTGGYVLSRVNEKRRGSKGVFWIFLEGVEAVGWEEGLMGVVGVRSDV